MLPALLVGALHLDTPPHVPALAGILGVWLIIAGPHEPLLDRPPRAVVRELRRAEWIPAALGLLMALVGAYAAMTALVPSVEDHYSLLHKLGSPLLEPDVAILRLPLGVLMLVLSVPIARRRRTALPAAVGVLTAIAALDLARGPQLDEAALVLGVVGVAVMCRSRFTVHPDPVSLGTALRRAPMALAGVYAGAVAAVWVTAPHATPHVTWTRALDQAASMLVLIPGPLDYHGRIGLLPVAVGAIGVGAMGALAWSLGRPLRTQRGRMSESQLAACLTTIRARGTDTLSFFKLRSDTDELRSPDGRAFLTYRIHAGVMLISGDPVGEPDAIAALLASAREHARREGLRLGVLGASQDASTAYPRIGLRRIYLGDEAIVRTEDFTLNGRPIRKVRQSVTRLERAGYRVAIASLAELADAEIASLRSVSRSWRGGGPERGFSMALDSIGGAHQRDTTVVIARDASGQIRGFLQFVPCYGRAAVSLAAMCRERDTPNGLTEYMVATAIGHFRDEGTAEVSLNFVVFARAMRVPAGRLERVFGRILMSRLGRGVQVASLHRFNAKFFPTWVPRDLWYEGRLGAARTGVAALLAEGQIPLIAGRGSGGD